jgi:uncharacterized PurR-regulated membrane protein YhhQ (DUF165 family)
MAAPAMRPALRALVLPVAAMVAAVAASNIAVQYPIRALGLDHILTWGALTYPVTFLVNDLTNRRFGATVARQVVFVGFLVAVVLSVWLATPRIALASGTAFLVGQMLDVTVFNRLRRQAWWRAPLAAGAFGSALDTALFFSLAFAGVPAMSVAVTYALPGGGVTVPLWAGLAGFDFVVKLGFAVLALLPYGALMAAIRPVEAVRARG